MKAARQSDSVMTGAGTVNGVPTVMANLWGKHLGVIGLRLRHDDGTEHLLPFAPDQLPVDSARAAMPVGAPPTITDP